MQISSRLPLPLICRLFWLWKKKKKQKLTSDILAGSVGVNQLLFARPCLIQNHRDDYRCSVGLEEQRLPHLKVLVCWTSIAQVDVWARTASSWIFINLIRAVYR